MPPIKRKADGPAAAARKLADWYRGFAERAGHLAIWEARLRTAEDLDAEAGRIERRQQRGIADSFG